MLLWEHPTHASGVGQQVLSRLQHLLQVKKRQSLGLVDFKYKSRVGCSVVEGNLALPAQCRCKEKWEKVGELVWGLCQMDEGTPLCSELNSHVGWHITCFSD